MRPTNKPDPYRIDANATDAARAPSPSRPIETSFDALMRRGMHVITPLRTQMLDAHEIESLGADLRAYLAKHRGAKVILDMNGVEHMSSAALGLLLTLKATIEGTGGGMCMCNVRPDLRKIFKLTKLDKVLPIKDSVDAAAAVL